MFLKSKYEDMLNKNKFVNKYAEYIVKILLLNAQKINF